MQDYILTVSKCKFTPLAPVKEDINIDDIAHALSMMARANGHYKQFYSVGQHSIYCAKEAIARGLEPHTILACLLHDASEAYLADITRPVKQHLSNYLEIEAVLQNTIFEKYIGEVSEEEQKIVAQIDDALLYYEFVHYMDERLFDEEPMMAKQPKFKNHDFSQVEKKFLKIFHQYHQADFN